MRFQIKFVLGYPQDAKGNYGYQISNGIDLFGGQLFGAWYAFNAVAIFGFTRHYVATSGDHAFLSEVAGSRTVLDWLRLLSADWKNRTLTGIGEPCLADYGSFAGDFLECVPTYINAVAALQAGNAWMSTEMAALERAVVRSAERAAALVKDAKCITDAVLRRQYIPQRGFFSTVNGSNKSTDVRTVVDFQTCGRWLGREVLGDERAAEMASFFHRELDRPALGWPIALSRSDQLKYIDRPDHGTTGSYASWPGLAFETLAELEGNFSTAMPFFLRTAPSARQGPYGQDQGVSIGPNEDVAAFKTTVGATRCVYCPHTCGFSCVCGLCSAAES
jgi:hypothetical protein